MESADVTRLRDWADAARAAFGVAQSLVKTSFVPMHYRDKPEEATAAILAGLELDLNPIASLNAFYPIQGTSAPKAMTLRAVVQRRGHEIEILETTEQRCVGRGRRRGAQEWQTITWTMQRATRLGLTRRDQWTKQPQAMLVARTTSELARLIGSDALMGIPYSFEELQDASRDDESVTTDTSRGNGRARRRTPADGAAERPATAATAARRPPLPNERPAAGSGHVGAEPTVPAPEPSTVAHPDAGETADNAVYTPDETTEGDPVLTMEDRLMKRLFALLHEAEVEDRHAFASRVLGTKIATFKDLRQSQALALITALTDDLNGDQESRDYHEGDDA